MELRGRTLGLVGLGRIGTLVATKAAGLGIRVLAYDPYVTRSDIADLVSLEALAHRSDFISLHAPLTSETRGMFDRSLLSQLKAGATLVNTARGELVDEAALIWALDEGPLAGAALDVLTDEPPPIDHPLRRRDDVLLSPHMGPHTAEATAAMGRIALEELVAVLSGQPPRFAI
jgi:D-3-phosphoglycerate dehydrogenase